jgi:hypothetical protein
VAIAYGAAGTALNQNVASTTFNVPYPATVAADDLLVLHVVTNGGTVADPAGWTKIYSELGVLNPRGGLWIKKAVGGETGTVAVTTTSSTGSAQMHSYTGVDTVTPQDAAATSKSLDGTTDVTIVLPSITTVNNNAWYVYACGENSTSVTNTSTGTERADFAAATLPKAGALYDGIQVTAGATGTKTITPSATRAYWGAMMVLRPSLIIAPVTYTPTGIASGETFGTAAEVNSSVASPTGIPSAEAMGTPSEFSFRAYTFDDGTAQGWTAKTTGAGTTAISAAAAKSGNFGVSANVPAATADQAGFNRTIVGGGAHRVRLSGWWKVTTEGASTTSNVPFARMFKGTQRLADVYRQNAVAGTAQNVWLRIVKAAGGANYWFIGTGYNLPLDTWVFIDFVWGTDGKPEVYINGTQVIAGALQPADWFAAADIDTVWLGSQEIGNQGAWAIDSVEVQTIPGQPAIGEGRPLAILSGETFGAVAAIQPITATPAGIVTEEVFGAVIAAPTLLSEPTGIASEEAFGTTLAAPAIVATVTGGIASAEAIGTAYANVAQTASPTGIDTGEAFGAPSGTIGTMYVTGGITTAEAFGTAAHIGSLRASPAGIDTAEAIGSATWTPGNLAAAPGGIASEEAFGTPLKPIPGTIATPTGIDTTEALGVPVVNVKITAEPAGIVTAEIVDNINAILTYTATPAGIASGETFGAPSQAGLITASPTGIASEEAFGTPTRYGITVYPVGIVTAEWVSNIAAQPALTASPMGIESASAFGTAVQTNVLTVQAPTLDTGAAVGTPTALGSLTAAPAGIPSGYTSGFPSVTYATILAFAGISTVEAFGTATVTITTTTGRHLDIEIEDMEPRFDVTDLDERPGFDWATGIGMTVIPEDWVLADIESNWTTARLEGEPMTRVILKSAGATEQVGGTITEKTGKDLTSTVVQISLGSEQRPGTWTTPSVNVLGPANVRKVTMLVGVTPDTPKGEYWAWVKITDTPEIITLRFPQKILVK